MYSNLRKVVVVVALASTVPVQASAFAPNAAIKSVTGNVPVVPSKPLTFAK